MVYLLCMNKLKDYSVWRKIFDSHKPAHINAGFILKSIWRSADDPNEVYFILGVDSKEKAEAFFKSEANTDIAEKAGVIDGWIKYIDELDMY